MVSKIVEIQKCIFFFFVYKEEKKTNEEETKRNQEKIERSNKIMTNIEIYDGTSNGQVEVK